MRLTGKVALVTGSTSGIGLGIARALAGQGAAIMLNGFGLAADIERLRAGIEHEFGVRAVHDGADLSNPGAVSELVAVTRERLGGPDVLVNNAGIQHVAAIQDFPEERWDAVLAINLSAAFHAMKAAIPAMKQAGWGRIVNIASAHGLVASEGKAAYVAAKHGLIGLTKTAAIELANSGITVNAICPGWVLTPLVRRQIEERARRNGTDVEREKAAVLAEKQPMTSFTTPEQIGGLTVFLCSPAASTITGAAISIDVGWTAQ
jgi:3-hydroxybutyrate dehydrogenase